MSTEAGTTEETFRIGTHAHCRDGRCGVLIRVVVDPVARAVTHLVVAAQHHQGRSRLVPVDLVESGGADVQLRCTLEAFGALEAAEETRFLPGSSGYGTYRTEESYSWPYYQVQSAAINLGMGGDLGRGVGLGYAADCIRVETAPPGEVSVRRGDPVYATDGPIGRVQGLVVDRDSRRVTHVLLEEGHLWGRKQVTIPIGAVSGLDVGVQVDLARQQIEDLPELAVDHVAG